MIKLVRKMFYDLTTDDTNGRFLATKIGEVVVGITWTFYMLTAQPDSVEMWLAFAATVMGWSSIRYAMKKFAPSTRPGVSTSISTTHKETTSETTVDP